MAETQKAICCMCKHVLDDDERRYRCSVSSCNAGRLKLRFCSVECWQAHLPTARHRNADYVEITGEDAASAHV